MKALKDKDVKEELFLTDIVRSKRPYKDDRGRGVIINTYVSRTANNREYLRIKFLGQDVDRLPYKVAVGLSPDNERLYFFPDDRGFKLTPENKSSSSSVIAIEVSKKYMSFVGKYKKLEYDQNAHLFFVAKESKEKKDEQVTLDREEYDKIMELVKIFNSQRGSR